MVSIILPAYNCERYIDKCIDSLVHQTYADLQIIVIDDGSSDNTWQKLQGWTQKDSRIIARHFENSGVVTTRKRGLELAMGDMLMFVDSDDYLPEEAVSILVNAAQTSDGLADVVVGGYTLEWADTGRQVPVRHPKHFTTPAQCAAYCLKYGETFLPIKLYSTSLYKEVVDIPTDVCVQEDTIGILQLLRHCKSVAHTDKSIYYYLKHSDSASYALTPRHLNSLLKVAETICGMYSDCDDKVLLNEIGYTSIKNLYTYINYTPVGDRNVDAIHKVLDFLRKNSLNTGRGVYQLQTVKISLRHPKIASMMISVNNIFGNTIYKIKKCVRKVLK